MPFRHAAARRVRSESIFVRLHLDNGIDGWGEALPRPYVTDETVDEAVRFLRDWIGPAISGRQFTDLADAVDFLTDCDGAAPTAWAPATSRHAAAWSAIDLALLDAFARADGRSVLAGLVDPPSRRDESAFPVRYSGVASADRRSHLLATLAKMRLFGLRQVKLKADTDHAVEVARTARHILGHRADIRVDANMAWPAADAEGLVNELGKVGIAWFEQPVAACDMDTMAQLVARTGASIVADESFTSRASLDSLIARRACTGVNVRISKCGGLVAALARCRQALDAGLDLQVGCHVGESSLLSSAQLTLLAALSAHESAVRYAEGCYGERLLARDPASPKLQFGYGGRPPARPDGLGFGVSVDQSAVGIVADAASARP
jgi:muconate cycloisomerase